MIWLQMTLHPAALWCADEKDVRLVRVPRPTVNGHPTGGWWVLYRGEYVVGSFEYRKDQWQHPPRRWANHLLRKA